MEHYNYFEYEYYITKYKDLSKMDKKQALEHLKKYGIKEKRKFNKLLENFDYNFYVTKYKDLSKFNYLQACNHYIKHGINENRQCYKIIKKDILHDFKDFLKTNNILHVRISKPMQKFNRILSIYNLTEFSDDTNIVINNFIIFGIYNKIDLDFVLNYIFQPAQIMFILLGGSDYFYINKYINKLYLNKNIKFLSISQDMHNRLHSHNITSTLINFNLVDSNIFKPMPHIEQTKIYLYDGDGKGKNKYNIDMLNKIKSLLPHFKYIKTSDYWKNNKLIPNNDMPIIYAQCFIGLRLTEHDGNANTVQEFEAMKIPIVHNQSNYGLKWNNINDIIKHINDIYNSKNK
tara:strand:- start:14090 stop:15127 length:1038 start_codon:yes stop_codon:yes gene_type:complete